MHKQYINGEWVDASNGKTWDVINPATEEVIVIVPLETILIVGQPLRQPKKDLKCGQKQIHLIGLPF